MALADSKTLKAMIEFREGKGRCTIHYILFNCALVMSSGFNDLISMKECARIEGQECATAPGFQQSKNKDSH